MEPSPRKRQLVQTATMKTNAYRLYFSCEHIGKYRRQTKRRIKWSFGFTNLQAAREGKRGIDCRGEEHEVELVWSVKSGKTKVYWNKCNISHLFRGKRKTDMVDITWESRSGEKFRISAHESSTRFGPQYDFLVDGVSIFSLAHLSDLNPVMAEKTVSDPEVRSESTPDTRSDGGCSMEYDTFDETLDVGFRLSMAGFSPTAFTSSCEPSDDLMDELTSTSFTSLLESLRKRITSIIPNSEDMVSRAIVKALSDDTCETPSCSSSVGSSCSLDSVLLSAIQIEADAIWETKEWINLNVQYAPRPDVAEQKRDFLQKHMDAVFVHAHNDRLTEDAAARILSDIAILLGIPLRIFVPKDTLVLEELDKNTDCESLLLSMIVFGEVQEVGLAHGQRFAICRFVTERGPLRALAAAEHGTLIVNGKHPHVSLLEMSLVSARPERIERRVVSNPLTCNEPVPRPSLTRRKSHQRNTVQIDTLISETPFLSLVNEPVVVSPLELQSFIKSASIGKIMDTSFGEEEISTVSPPGSDHHATRFPVNG